MYIYELDAHARKIYAKVFGEALKAAILTKPDVITLIDICVAK
jgi:hypothetical protein